MPQPQESNATVSVPEVPRGDSQAFFAQLAAESLRPSYGGQERDFIRSLLIRAEESKLYDPTR